MCSLDIDELSLTLASGIIEEPLSLIKPGNVSRMYDAHITLRRFVYGCTPIVSIVNQCIRDSMRGKIFYGYYIYKILKTSLNLVKENVCAGTSLMIIPLAISIGYLARHKLLRNLKEITYTATFLLKRYSTCNDTVMLYRALRELNISYVKCRNSVPALPNIYDENSFNIIVKQNLTLWKLLRYCSSIDICSRQVVTYYVDILELLEIFKRFLYKFNDLDYAILLTYYKALSSIGDTMILRKHGYEIFYYLKNIGDKMFKLCLEDANSCIEESKRIHKIFVEKSINPGSIADVLAIMLSLYRIEKLISNTRRV